MPTSLNTPSRLTRAIRAALAVSPLVFLPHNAAAQDVDLGNLGDRGFRIDGINVGDRSGYSVAGAGDVNGDGLADLIVGAPSANSGDSGAGESYVVFGKADSTAVDLADLGTGGFRIDGINIFDFSGRSLSGAGDVNGDGLADLIVGAYWANPGGNSDAGESYVVFGKADSTTVNLADLGTGGFRIEGIDANDRSGFSVSGAGDVNGDGLADLIVGAFGGDSGAGESYVVFGKASPTTVDLANLGTGGFRIDGIDAGDYSGTSVSGAGDVNGDGLADLIVGAPNADSGGRDAGESYVVFGKADSAPVDLANLGDRGFRIDGIDFQDSSGISVSGAGDVNGDGLADLIVGAYRASPGGNSRAGESYVVFGKADPATVDLADLGTGGFRIDGIDAGDLSGYSVSGAGDVNGDGLADLIVGAPFADAGGDYDAGESYVVFGKADNAPVNLADLGTGGFRIDGFFPYDRSGLSVSGAGDVNGDGLADLIVGAPFAEAGGDTYAGESYVVFSASVPPPSATYRARSRNGDAPPTAVGVSGDGSNDSTPDARFWIDFADGSDLIRDASIELVTLTRSPGALPMPGALVSWRLQSSRQDWTAAEVTVRYLDSELLASEDTLQLVFSPDGSAPFLPLTTFVNPQNNTLRASISQPGYLYIGGRPENEPVDLGNLGDRGFRIDGVDVNDRSGLSVSGAGDVNGDGLADLIIGASVADPGGDNAAGESYVVFGKAESTPVDLADLGAGGFRIDGIDAFDFSGRSVSGAGDVNGDGLTDLIVGARGADAGESYVVFGKADSATVNLADLGAGGFVIDGIDANDYAGTSVSSAGDINGDGLADLIVGAWGADPGGNREAGESYVVFGKTDSAPVDLANLGAGGFRIDGIDADDRSGYSVSGAGDVNGDGLADLIVGAWGADPGGNTESGESYVVFGKADNAPVDLANLGDRGFRIEGIDAGDESGRSVSGAGDVNGDGLADLIVGARNADPNGASAAGESYVVFGKIDSATVDLANLGDRGFRIEGIDTNDYAGTSVAAAGDVNGDGLADLIVGARSADPNGASAAGESYVVFGKTDSAPVDLANLGAGGFRLDGIDGDDRSGASVSGAGDVNGDGLADLIVGAYGADPGGNSEAGESYVVFSASVPLPSATYRVRSRNGDAPPTAVGVSGDGSNDSTPDARFWIDFADGNDLIDEASLEAITLTRSPGALPSAGASISWRLQSSRQNWTTADITVRYLDSELLAAENALELVFSPNGSAPFTSLASQVNPHNNTLTATISQPGFIYIGRRELPDSVFLDRFELPPD